MASQKKNNYKSKQQLADLGVLISLFGQCLHVDIVESVARSQHWNLEKTIEILSEMSANIAPNVRDIQRAKMKFENESRSPLANAVPYSKITSKKPPKLQKPPVNQNKTPTPNKPPPQNKDLQRIRSKITNGYRILVFLRGVPGCGKSHLAKHLVTSTLNMDHKFFVFSTDDFFYRTGTYNFNPVYLPEAHSWNQKRVRDACYMGISPIIVDNTNLQQWEMNSYLRGAVENGYMIEMLIPSTPWAFHAAELARRNVHSVPKQKIEDMLLRFDKKITPNVMLANLGLQYPPGLNPPLLRQYPPLPEANKKVYNIPVQLQRDAQVAAEKKRRQRKRKKPTDVATETNSEKSAESVSYCDDQSDTWESDEGEWNDVMNQRDLLTNSDMEYVVVNPDNTFTYQRDHSQSPKEENEENLINFDTETENLIQLTDNENDFDDVSDAAKRLQALVIPYDEENAAKGLFNLPKLDVETSVVEPLDIFLKTNPAPRVDKVERKYSQELLLEMTNKDASTNTTSTDFSTLTKPGENVKVVYGTARSIIDATIPKDYRPPPRVLMLDKGTMTGVENIMDMISPSPVCTKSSEHFSELTVLFPNVPEDVLKDLFDKCQGDVNWTVELLLENNYELGVVENVVECRKGSECVEGCVCGQKYDVEPFVQAAQPDVENETETETKISTPKQKNRFKSSGDDLLKKQIEEQVRIGDEHYSDHVLNLRKKRYGIVDPPPEPPQESTPPADPDHDDDDSVSSSEETFEFNFGINFIEQLETHCGNPNVEYPKGLQPVLQLPASIIRQLHSLWVESICTQIQTQNTVLQEMERQDLEFARLLQEKERSLSGTYNKVPDLQEIMDMEIALAVCKADQEQWKKETPNDLASRMTRQKLFEAFPAVNKDSLAEILQAHDNNFEETVQALLCSLGQTNTDSLMNVNGKIMSKTGDEDIAKQKLMLEEEINEMPKSLPFKPFQVDDDVDIDPKKSASHYRDVAAHHLEMRQELYRKASEAIKKGMPQVASYYSEVAKLHKQKYEYANNQAATAFLSEHSMNHKDSRTIDLHYLYVKEAEQALAMFLDCHISRVQQSKLRQDSLFIITGRGKNSQDGVSHIKPAIKKKLKERKLGYSEMNPGLLKVVITKHSILTNDLKHV